MMKIKREVLKTLPQLIEWVWESEKSDGEAKYFKCKGENETKHIIYANPTGGLNLDSERFYDKNDLFIVEVEEEITEDTEFKSMVEVTIDGLLDVWGNANISAWKDVHSKEFHAYIDGEFKCIWRDGKLVE